MADLPAGNFLKYSAIPERFPTVPTWAAAIADLFANFLRGFAPTAREELLAIEQGRTLAEITPLAFGETVARWMAKRMTGAAAESDPLAASYRELNRAILADSTRAQWTSDMPDAAAIAEIGRKAEGGRVQPGDVAQTRPPALGGYGLGYAAHVLGWAYILMKSRRDHLQRYRRRFASAGLAPSLLFNHLVDYDHWLHETPSAGADMLTQVAVWERIRHLGTTGVDMRLYAGVCPLKLAIQRLNSGPADLDHLVDAHRSGSVFGFKLYPPMGFRAIGNAALADTCFDPKQNGRTTALDHWRQAGGTGKLGTALDEALREIYRTAVANRIPIMAHVARTNGAGPGYRDRANPLYWAAVTREFPIRLTLGHLVDNVVSFVDAVEHGQAPPDVWSLATSVRLLDPRGKGAVVYGDLSYSSEILGDRTLARRFFSALRSAFGQRDPELTRILYGTDWIMLGLERHDERYLDCVVQGMRDAGYSPVQQQNILKDNLARFIAT